MPRVSPFRAEGLPQPFPGCWRDRDFRREYKRTWESLRRRDREYCERHRQMGHFYRAPKLARPRCCYFCDATRGLRALRRARVAPGNRIARRTVWWCGRCQLPALEAA